jgi:hypothetical protein
MECKYHVVFTPKYRKKAVWADQAAIEIFGGGGDRVLEREKLDLGLRRMSNASAQSAAYIKNQEMADKELDQLQLKLASS